MLVSFATALSVICMTGFFCTFCTEFKATMHESVDLKEAACYKSQGVNQPSQGVSGALCICLFSRQAGAKLVCRPLGTYQILWRSLLLSSVSTRDKESILLKRVSRAPRVCLFSWQAGVKFSCRALGIYQIIWRPLLLSSVSTSAKECIV